MRACGLAVVGGALERGRITEDEEERVVEVLCESTTWQRSSFCSGWCCPPFRRRRTPPSHEYVRED